MTLYELLPIERKLFILDTETTGSNAAQDRIVQIGFLQLKPDGGIDEWESLVNPGISIPPEATYGKGEYPGHGITDEMVQGCRLCKRPRGEHGPEGAACPFQAWPYFADLAPHLMRGFQNCDYAGYNCNGFDLPLLRAEFKRAGHVWSYADARMVDGYRLWQLGQKRSLSDAVEHFLGRAHEGAHGALPDVRATHEVIVEMLRRFQTLPHTLDQLHQLQWPRDPNAIDDAGKFVWKNGVAVVNFGKWKDTMLHKVDKGYLKWMLDYGNFPDDTKKIVTDVLEGRLPKLPEEIL